MPTAVVVFVVKVLVDAAALSAEVVGPPADVAVLPVELSALMEEKAGYCRSPDEYRPRCKTVVRHLETIGYRLDNVSSAVLVDDRRATFKGKRGKGKEKSASQDRVSIAVIFTLASRLFASGQGQLASKNRPLRSQVAGKQRE